MAPGVLPDGLQQHEAACGAIRPAMHDEVLRDEPREDREGRLRDGAFGLTVPPPANTASAANTGRSAGISWAWLTPTSLRGCADGPARRAVRWRPQGCRPSLRKARRRTRFQAARGELDGQRQPVQPPAHVQDGRGRLRREAELIVRGSGDRGEEPQCRRRPHAVSRVVRRDRKGIESDDTLRAEMQRLATDDKDARAGSDRDKVGDERADSCTCSKLSSRAASAALAASARAPLRWTRPVPA